MEFLSELKKTNEHVLLRRSTWDLKKLFKNAGIFEEKSFLGLKTRVIYFAHIRFYWGQNKK